MKHTLLFILFPLLIFSQTKVGESIPIDARHIEVSADGQTIVLVDNTLDYVNVKTYKHENSNWVNYVGSDISENNEMGIWGSSLRISKDGNFLAVGSSNERLEEQIGVVKVFNNINNQWVQVGDDIKTDIIDDGFGRSVRGNGIDFSSDGSIIAIGARQHNNNNEIDNGLVKVYKNNSGTWEQLGTDIIGDPSSFTGAAVSLSENGLILAVGAPRKNDWNGQIKIYEFENNNWNQIGNTIEGNTESTTINTLGYNLSISNNGKRFVTSSATADGRIGNVQVFENINNNWIQLGQTLYGTGDNYDGQERFGQRISLSSEGNTLAISSFYYTNVYEITGNTINKLDLDIQGITSKLSADGSHIAIEQVTTNQDETTTSNVAVYKIDDTLSNKEYHDTTFNVYPNPSNNTINITLKPNEILKDVKIITITGKNIITSTDSKIDVSNLSSGIYQILIETEKGKSSKKLIIE